ncbi:unnamed protein product [Dicrocoelium dendriticum]|nr:unnamed protein product [Dicrocoelium dendriticum]
MSVSNPDSRAWEISELLAEEAHLPPQVMHFTSPTGFHHIFISAKSHIVGQIAYIGRRLDRLLHHYHFRSQSRKSDPGELWLHGIGKAAVERTIELALHLQTRMYPGHIEAVVQTSACPTVQQGMKLLGDGTLSVNERQRSKPAVHIQLRLCPTRG